MAHQHPAAAQVRKHPRRDFAGEGAVVLPATSCAPHCAPVSPSQVATWLMNGNGGQTATSTRSSSTRSSCARSPPSSRSLAVRSPFIFQLPITSGWRCRSCRDSHGRPRTSRRHAIGLAVLGAGAASRWERGRRSDQGDPAEIGIGTAAGKLTLMRREKRSTFDCSLPRFGGSNASARSRRAIVAAAIPAGRRRGLRRSRHRPAAAVRPHLRRGPRRLAAQPPHRGAGRRGVLPGRAGAFARPRGRPPSRAPAPRGSSATATAHGPTGRRRRTARTAPAAGPRTPARSRSTSRMRKMNGTLRLRLRSLKL